MGAANCHYGLRNPNGKLVAVARISPCPYGNAPAVAAVGAHLTANTAYLMRQCAVGISHEELVEFIRNYTARFRRDMSARNPQREREGKPPYDFRYLLSLDDPYARLIESSIWGVLAESPAASGKIYIEAGALDGGQTSRRGQAIRYIDEDSQVRSVYQGGRNLLPELIRAGVPLVHEAEKRRFLWVLESKGSLLYHAWRQALPEWIREPVWGQNGLGWAQNRLFIQGWGLCPA